MKPDGWFQKFPKNYQWRSFWSLNNSYLISDIRLYIIATIKFIQIFQSAFGCEFEGNRLEKCKIE